MRDSAHHLGDPRHVAADEAGNVRDVLVVREQVINLLNAVGGIVLEHIIKGNIIVTMLERGLLEGAVALGVTKNLSKILSVGKGVHVVVTLKDVVLHVILLISTVGDHTDKCIQYVLLLLVHSVDNVLDSLIAARSGRLGSGHAILLLLVVAFGMRKSVLRLVSFLLNRLGLLVRVEQDIVRLDELDVRVLCVVIVVRMHHDSVDIRTGISPGKYQTHLSNNAVHNLAAAMLELVGVDRKGLDVAVLDALLGVESRRSVVEEAVRVHAVGSILKKGVSENIIGSHVIMLPDHRDNRMILLLECPRHDDSTVCATNVVLGCVAGEIIASNRHLYLLYNLLPF